MRIDVWQIVNIGYPATGMSIAEERVLAPNSSLKYPLNMSESQLLRR